MTARTESPLPKLQDAPSLQQQAYLAIRDAILGHRYAPGERLTEVGLADALGISRSPVREALRRLQQDCLVVIGPRGQIRVSSISMAEVKEVYLIRRGLEGAAAGLAAERATDEDIRILEQIVSERPLNDDAHSQDVSAATRFHHAIQSMTGSQRLVMLLEPLQSQIRHFRNITLGAQKRSLQAYEGHLRILDAIRRGDPDRAEELARHHVQEAMEAMLRHVEESADQPSETSPTPR